MANRKPPSSANADTARGSADPVKGKIGKTGFAKPADPLCTNCTVGIVELISYDPEAINERGQAIYAPRDLSGGNILVRCRNCGATESIAIDPHPAPEAPGSV